MSLLGVPKDILRLIAQQVINITQQHRATAFALTCKACAEAVAWCRPFDVAACAIRNNNVDRMHTYMRRCDHARLLNVASYSGNVVAWYMLSQLTNQPCNISDMFIVRCQHDIETLQLAFQRASNPDQIVNCLRTMDGKLDTRVYACALEYGIPITITHANFIHLWPRYAHLIPADTCWQFATQSQHHDFIPMLEEWLRATDYTPTVAYQPRMVEWMLEHGYPPAAAHGFNLPLCIARSPHLWKHQTWIHDQLAQHDHAKDLIAILKAVDKLTPDEKTRFWEVRYIETAPQLFHLTDDELDCEVIRFPEVCESLAQCYHPHDFGWMGQFNTEEEVLDALDKELHTQHNICKLMYYEAQQNGKKYAEFIITRMHLFLDKWILSTREQCEPMRQARLYREKMARIAEECGDVSDYECSSEHESMDAEESSADESS
jgi:hypothetical protein